MNGTGNFLSPTPTFLGGGAQYGTPTPAPASSSSSGGFLGGLESFGSQFLQTALPYWAIKQNVIPPPYAGYSTMSPSGNSGLGTQGSATTAPPLYMGLPGISPIPAGSTWTYLAIGVVVFIVVLVAAKKK